MIKKLEHKPIELHGNSIYVKINFHSQVIDMHLCRDSSPANNTKTVPTTNMQVDSVEISSRDHESEQSYIMEL